MFEVSNNRRSNKKSSRNNRAKRRPRTFEGLEQRNMFAVSTALGVVNLEGANVDALVINGSNSAETVMVSRLGSKIHVNKGHHDWVEYDASKVDVILFHGHGGSDTFSNSTDLPVWANLGAGDDYFSGGSGNDIVLGGSGVDTIYGNGGSDAIDGQGGGDWIYGGADVDALFGGDDDDWIFGGTDTDYLFGGHGRDHLAGDTGADLLDGGSDTSNDDMWMDKMGEPGTSFLVGNQQERDFAFRTYYGEYHPDDPNFDLWFGTDSVRGKVPGDVILENFDWQTERYINPSINPEQEFRKFGKVTGVPLRWDSSGPSFSLVPKSFGGSGASGGGRFDDVFHEPVVTYPVALRYFGFQRTRGTSVVSHITTQVAPLTTFVPRIAPSLAVAVSAPVSQTATRLAAAHTNFIPPNPVTPVATNPTSAPAVVIVVDTPVTPINLPVSSVANAILKSSSLSAAKAAHSQSGDNWGG